MTPEVLTAPAETIEPAKDDGPLLAHIAFDHSPQVAFCGKKILGVPAPKDADLCLVCADMEEVLKRELRKWER